MSNTYYQDELRYLRDVGPEFARANPEIASFLADRGSDPDVERMLEGVAFLCGRIREKLDDELPEFTASMMSLLWPHYLRPVPSMTILELIPDLKALRGAMHVDTGTEFASIPIDGTRCRYRSCWPVTLRPWALREVRLETELAKPVRLVMQLQTGGSAKLEDLELGTVRFHLAGDAAAAFALYMLLAGHVDNVAVSDGSSRHNRAVEYLDASHVSAAGLSRSEGLLDYPRHSFPGYRLLQEYFAFKERFLFVDVRGLDRVVEKLELEQTIELAFTFNRRMETFPLVARENVRLHCVPIINLFSHSADPIRLHHDRVQYLIQPSKAGIADRRHAEVYSVDGVWGMNQAAGIASRELQPFYSFTHMTETDPSVAAYYQTHTTPNVLGGDRRLGTDTYISFVIGSGEGELPEEETISIEMSCTNRDLPSELRAGDICDPTDTSPPGVRFRNLIKPTPTISPPLGKGLHWRLISHMSLNYVSLTNAERFRELLRVYDFQSEGDVEKSRAHKRMLDGIVSVRSSFQERMVRGAPLRGSQVEIELNEDHFAGEGDAYLFASVLDRFMGLYVTLNGYSQITARFTRCGETYVFPPRCGDQITPAESRRNHDRIG
ncbi:MAG: type VI secretion system baseplate subunit TssF [Phycisphaerae bacterium]|nr:type VI secretion system baseplate subunit TssF [Phycisphaerae bacterium]